MLIYCREKPPNLSLPICAVPHNQLKTHKQLHAVYPVRHNFNNVQYMYILHVYTNIMSG